MCVDRGVRIRGAGPGRLLEITVAALFAIGIAVLARPTSAMEGAVNPEKGPKVGYVSAAVPIRPTDPASPAKNGGIRSARTGQPENLHPAPGSIRFGDALKIVFYETLDQQENAWKTQPGRSVPPKGFFQREELSGEYQIGSDGAISLPMIGRIAVVGLQPREVEAALAQPFEALIERKGYVNLLGVRHEPVYVAGPVRNPGGLPYDEGMTVLQAISLAGGIDQDRIEPWQKIEIAKQSEKIKASLEDLSRLVARTKVLLAERQGQNGDAAVKTGLASSKQAALLVNDEEWQRSLVAVSREATRLSLMEAIKNARSEFEERSSRSALLSDTLKMRQQRVDSMLALADKKLIANPVIVQVQADLADVTDRIRQADIDAGLAKRRVAEAERQLAAHDMETKIELEKALNSAEEATAQAVSTSEADLAVLDALSPARRMPSNEDGSSEVQITRRGPDGVAVIAADESTILEPGDVVRIGPKY